MEAPAKPNFIVSEATAADLPALVEVQFKAFATLPIELLVNGHGTKEEQLSVIKGHQAHIDENSGLCIVKVEAEIEAPAVAAAAAAAAASTNSTDHNLQANHNESRNDRKRTKVVGFCMFYLPNEDATTPELRIPPSLRPPTAPSRMPHILDAKTRSIVETFSNMTKTQTIAAVAGRGEAAYVRYMAVDPAYQRQGVGSLLMEWGCRLLDQKGMNAALEATERGRFLYMRHGFEAVGWAEAPDGTEQGARFAVMWRNARKLDDGELI